MIIFGRCEGAWRCQRYIGGVDGQCEDLVAMAEDAIERNLQIIGEAVDRLPAQITDAHPEIAWPQIRGFLAPQRSFRARPRNIGSPGAVVCSARPEVSGTSSSTSTAAWTSTSSRDVVETYLPTLGEALRQHIGVGASEPRS